MAAISNHTARSDQSISESCLVYDVGTLGTQFLAQTCYMHVDRAFADTGVVGPYGIDNLLAGKVASRMLGKEGVDEIFAFCQARRYVQAARYSR